MDGDSGIVSPSSSGANGEERKHPTPISYDDHPWRPGLPFEEFELRLIELYPPEDITEETEEPDLGSNMLKCRMFRTPLSSQHPYKALSYVWGRAPPSEEILIDGYPFAITESLATALRHLHRPTESITLWIDQICINQLDLQEKGEQVAHMNLVYQEAEEVLVWLGPAFKGSDEFVDVWATVGEWAEDWGLMTYYTRERLPLLTKILQKVDPTDSDTTRFHHIIESSAELFTSSFLTAMIAWHNQKWFSRAWVVQEFSLARMPVFICGHKSITADQALLARQIFDNTVKRLITHANDARDDERRNAIIILAERLDPTQPFFGNRMQMKKWRTGDGPGLSLFQLLQKLYIDHKLEAKFHYDLIYALLGLANDRETLNICTDYTLSEQSTFCMVTRAIITKGNLEILSLSQYEKMNPDLPSWVPDWRSYISRTFAHQSDPLEPRYFKASGGLHAIVQAEDDECILGLVGFRVDIIDEVGGPWTNWNSYTETRDSEFSIGHATYLSYLAQVKLMCTISASRNPSIYSSPLRRAEAIWRIPIGDIEQTSDFDRVRATSSFQQAYDDCVSNLEYFEQKKLMPAEELKRAEQEFSARMERKLQGRYRSRMREMLGRRPFLTEQGYVGVGPAYLQRGDLVVVLRGVTIPYVVRAKGEQFRLVGECYCDGIMDGELVGQRQEETFYLV